MRTTLIEAIHATPLQLVAVAAGGGSDGIAELLRVPGASRTLLEGVIPYSAGALERFLGGVPERACSEETARMLAMQALLRAVALAPDGDRDSLAGVACTASLASDREKRGEHRCHVAVHTCTECRVASLVFAKGRRTRAEEEALASTLLINEITELARIPDRLDLALADSESVQRQAVAARPGWSDLLLGESDLIPPPNQDAALPVALLPGAFNPLHEGHLAMAKIASSLLGGAVALELSILNADKPPLDFLEIAERTDRIAREADLYLTRAPTFLEKAGLFPGSIFVVGTDTLVRIADPRFYGGNEASRDGALRRIRDAGCRFLVFGRRANGEFSVLSDLAIPTLLAEICDEVTEADFRMDISSTAIRRELGDTTKREA